MPLYAVSYQFDERTTGLGTQEERERTVVEAAAQTGTVWQATHSFLLVQADLDYDHFIAEINFATNYDEDCDNLLVLDLTTKRYGFYGEGDQETLARMLSDYTYAKPE